MKEKDLKRLSRADLLEMLIDQSKEVQMLRKRVEVAEAALERREIIIGSSGSIAEASLRLSGVFEAAQAACEQYIDNIRMLSDRQNVFYRQFEVERKPFAATEQETHLYEAVAQERPLGPRRARRRAAGM